MAKDRLNRTDLEEFKKRMDLLSSQQRAVNNTEIANEFWMKVKIRQLGLDETKNYKIMRETGKIIALEENGDKRDKGVPGDGNGKVDEGVSALEA